VIPDLHLEKRPRDSTKQKKLVILDVDEADIDYHEDPSQKKKKMSKSHNRIELGEKIGQSVNEPEIYHFPVSCVYCRRAFRSKDNLAPDPDSLSGFSCWKCAEEEPA